MDGEVGVCVLDMIDDCEAWTRDPAVIYAWQERGETVAAKITISALEA